MAMSGATTAWVVSGAIGLATFTGGVFASGGTGASPPAAPQPAVTVTVAPGPAATGSPTAKETSAADPSGSGSRDDAPSPVSPPSAETPD